MRKFGASILTRVLTNSLFWNEYQCHNPGFLRYCSTKTKSDLGNENASESITANLPSQSAPERRASLKNILNRNSAGDFVRVQGWVRGLRKQKLFVFLEVNDGSTFHKLPIVVPAKEVPRELSMHCTVEVAGELFLSPKNPATMELHPTEPVKIISECDQSIYPLGGKIRYEDEHVRQFLHLRSKTNKYSSLFRLRSEATKAVNDFFYQNDFVQIHTPVLTSNDCEGAGEVFLVRPANEKLMLERPNVKGTVRGISPKEFRKVQTHDHADLPFDGQKHLHPHKCDVCDNIFTHVHTRKPAHVSQSYDNHYCEEHKHLRKETPKDFNPEEAFFDRKAFLTVSGQLHLEAMTSGLEKVWTFSPVFRSENTQSTRHLSEFYMVEAEIGFAKEMKQILEPMEGLVKSVVHDILYGNNAELNFYAGMEGSSDSRNVLEKILKHRFTTMTYKEASHLLQTKANSTVSPSQGISREQELLLVEKLNDNIPVFVVDWPKELKPFYMRQTPDDPSAVSAVDLLVPGVGELCGGSLREDNLETLLERTRAIDPTGQLEKSLGWYFDLRRFGGNPTGGFGMGFDRLLQLILGVKNIRDVVPFPRWPHNCSM